MFLVLKSILMYVKDVSLTKPTLMGGQKGMGGGVGCSLEKGIENDQVIQEHIIQEHMVP